MIFNETTLLGAYVIEPEIINDDRGHFARVWCRDELEKRGLKADLAQSNVAFSHRKGTLRGLHFQRAPWAEVKVVRCTRGAMFDVIVDMRPESATYKRWFGIELSDANCLMLYVPEGLAHGYITLMDSTEMNYHASQFYNPRAAFGVRYSDPAFNIRWPVPANSISEQDRNWPLIREL